MLLNTAFTYTITSDKSNAVLNATGLPTGLTINRTTGVISGTPTVGGTYNVNLSAETASSTDVKTLQSIFCFCPLTYGLIPAMSMRPPPGQPVPSPRQVERIPPLPFTMIRWIVGLPETGRIMFLLEPS